MTIPRGAGGWSALVIVVFPDHANVLISRRQKLAGKELNCRLLQTIGALCVKDVIFVAW